MRVYYDRDADVNLIKGKKVLVVGYGSQGHAHAMNLRDSGVKDVRIALKPGSATIKKAEGAGFTVMSPADGAKWADIVMVLTPDELQSDIYNADLGPNMPLTQPVTEASERVLSYAGASLHRDSVDERIIRNVRERKGKVIDSQEEVGGWPVLRSLPAPVDSDHDGMPDVWEKTHGLNPNDPSDRNAVPDGDGYTNLEKYLNSLCSHEYSH